MKNHIIKWTPIKNSKVALPVQQKINVISVGGSIQIHMDIIIAKELSKLDSWQVPNLVLISKRKMGDKILKSISDIKMDKLISLDISYNLIQSLQCFSVLRAPVLKQLFLGWTNITNFTPMKKLFTKSLQLLAVDETKLKQLQGFSESSCCSSIKFLMLEYNTEDALVCQDIRMIMKMENIKSKITVSMCNYMRINQRPLYRKYKSKMKSRNVTLCLNPDS